MIVCKCIFCRTKKGYSHRRTVSAVRPTQTDGATLYKLQSIRQCRVSNLVFSETSHCILHSGSTGLNLSCLRSVSHIYHTFCCVWQLCKQSHLRFLFSFFGEMFCTYENTDSFKPILLMKCISFNDFFNRTKSSVV